jgi:hypothetical protein
VVTDDATTGAVTGAGVSLWQHMGLGLLAAQIPVHLVDQVLPRLAAFSGGCGGCRHGRWCGSFSR